MPQSQIPVDPLIYHITHVDNLAGILREGGLWSDAQRIAKNLSSRNIGYSHIKRRRLSWPVKTQNGGKLGEYVPFNFGPRSVMLFVVSQGHENYSGGQDDVVHLVSRVSVATSLNRPWAFTDRHAELGHALHYDDLSELDEIAWHVMGAKYWSSVKEERQAEFLVYDFFPWTAVEEIGTINTIAQNKVNQALSGIGHRPQVTVRPDWYY